MSDTIENMTPGVVLYEDETIYTPKDLLEPKARRNASSGAVSKIMTVHTREVQEYIGKHYVNLNKALAEIFRNSRYLGTLQVKESKKSDATKIVPVIEEQNFVREEIMKLQSFLESELERTGELAKDALSEGEQFVLTHPRKIQLLITTPEAKLFTYLIEVADYAIRNLHLAWINMEIDDKEKNDSISRINGELVRVSQTVKTRSRNFLNARMKKSANDARKLQKLEVKAKKKMEARTQPKESEQKAS